MNTLILSLLFISINYCESYKILGIFPHNGRSHHIYFSSLVEQLVNRGHNVTMVNYYPLEKSPGLRQIFLQEETNHRVDIEERVKLMSSDILMAYGSAKALTHIANSNCKKLMTHSEITDIIRTKEHFDVAIIEQFTTDCGLAIAHMLDVPTVGITAHILMPWTYSRLGASNNPAFVPNRSFATGIKPNIWKKVKSAIINFGLTNYFTHVTQRNDQQIVNQYYPEVPSLEELGKNMSLILLNQYFPVTNPRVYGPNVIEVGGMHIKQHAQVDEALQKFLDEADTGVIYISFGSTAANFPPRVTNEILKVIGKSNMKFVWKTEDIEEVSHNNVFIGKWMPQVAVLCHPNVVAFVSHSGMLSTTEAVHCGVPVVATPMFGDQYANGASIVESGLGVTIDVATFDEQTLYEALNIVLQDKYQKRAQELSRVWKDRPLSAMDTAVYWVEYVARNKGAVNMRPPTVDLPLFQYFMLDLLLVFATVAMLILFIIVKIICFLVKVYVLLSKLIGRHYKKKNV